MNLTTLLQTDLSSTTSKGLTGSISSSLSDKAGSTKVGFGQLMGTVEDIDVETGALASLETDIASLMDLLKQFGEDIGISVDQESGQIVITDGSEESTITFETSSEGELSFQLDGNDISVQQMLATVLKQAVADESAMSAATNNSQIINKIGEITQTHQSQMRVDIQNKPNTEASNLVQMLQTISNKSDTAAAPLVQQPALTAELVKPQTQVKTAPLDPNLVAVLNNTLSSNTSNSDSLQFKATIDNAKQSNLSELGQKLHSVLADKVSVQLSAKNQVATVRLDPPDLGKIDLTIKVENDKLQVQINASNHTTRESLNLTADKLRNELMGQNFLNVDVSIQQDNNGSSNETFVFNEEAPIQSGFNDQTSDSQSVAIESLNEKELARV